MAKKELTKFEQMGIIALIVVIACFFYVKKVYEPECKKFKAFKEKWIKLSKDVKDLKWEQGSSESALVSIQEKEEELKEAKSELKKASTVLANKEDLSEVLTRISHLAGHHNLKIREFSPVDEEGFQNDEKAFLKRSLHNLIIVGDFLDFKDFLKEIGYLTKLVTLEKVVIERENEGESLRIALLLSI